MKIAIIGHKRIPSHEGGIEKGVEQHAVRMAALGHEVHVYNRSGHNVFGKEYDNYDQNSKYYKNVRLITIPTFKHALNVPCYSFLATLRALFGRYDAISYRASGSCVMIGIAKLFGNRCVASLHGIDSQREKWGGFASKYLEFGERTAAQKADVCLVLSQNMKDYIDEKYHANSVLFANGIDRPELLEASLIKEYGLEKDGYILSLGRIVPEKRLQDLIHVFKKCRTDKKLVIAGGAERKNKDYYDSLVEAAAGDDRIIFVGYITGRIVGELYSNDYLFALPSNLEGMANTLLEAMSYGNCCLISDIPENTEVVGNKAIAFVQGDEVDLQEKLQFLLDNPDVVAKYKAEAADYVLKRYNWDFVVEQMLELYAGNIVSYADILKRHGIDV